jgi:hypothetical protein
LKSVVGPALGATLAALLAGCSKESAAPAKSEKQTPPPPPVAADAGQVEEMPVPGMMAAPPDASPKPIPDPGVIQKKKPIPKPGKRVPNPGKIAPPEKPHPKVGIRIAPDEEQSLEDRRGTRRGTDPSFQPMGAGAPRRVV